MKVQHVPNKIRREESDTRIINAAIKVFGLYGFTSSTISKIAKEANVSPGLITNRYASKNALFIDVFNHAFLRLKVDTQSIDSAKKFLIGMVDAIVNLYEEDLETYKFMSMILGSSDIPEKPETIIYETFSTTKAIEYLQEAQREGMIPDGDIIKLLTAYLSHIHIHVGVCKFQNMKLPSYEFFLSMFPYEGKEYSLKKKWDGILAKLVIDTFETMSYVNISDNSGEEIRKSDYSTAEITDDVHKRIIDISTERVCENDIKKVCDFFDFNTIDERFGKDGTISIQYEGKDGNKYRHILFVLNKDEKGRIKDLIAFVQKIDS